MNLRWERGLYFYVDFITAVFGWQQNWAKRSHTCPAPTYADLPLHMQIYPHHQHPALEWCNCYTWRTYTDTSKQPKVYSSPQGSLLMLDILWTLTNISTIIVSYRMVSCLRNSLLSIHPSHHPLATTDLFYFFHNFSFSRMSYSLIHTVCYLFKLAFFTW